MFTLLLLPASLILGGVALAYVKRLPVIPSREIEDSRAMHDSSATEAACDLNDGKQVFTDE